MAPNPRYSRIGIRLFPNIIFNFFDTLNRVLELTLSSQRSQITKVDLFRNHEVPTLHQRDDSSSLLRPLWYPSLAGPQCQCKRAQSRTFPRIHNLPEVVDNCG